MRRERRGGVAKPRAPQTLCNGCGCCCDPVLLPYNKMEVVSLKVSAAHRRWVMEDLTPMSWREARVLAPWYFDPNRPVTGLNDEECIPFFFRCRWFDRDSRMCTNYDARPEVCRNYPLYNGGMVLPGSSLPDPCSFNADIGIEPTPVDEYLARIRIPR